MAGHNKWSKIKRKKGANDAKKGKIFGRIIKEITIAIKEGGGVSDPGFNPRLRVAISNAKGANMPKENVTRAIKKAEESGGENYDELTYEGYAPGGVALFVECLSDNTNRTVSNVRAIFNKNGGSLATSGSVAFLFNRKAVFTFPKGERDLEELELELIDGGAEEMEVEEDEVTVYTAMEDFGTMQKRLEELDIETTNAGLQRIAHTPTGVDTATLRKAMRMIDLLDDDDDVQAIYHNMDITDEQLAELEAEG